MDGPWSSNIRYRLDQAGWMCLMGPERLSSIQGCAAGFRSVAGNPGEVMMVKKPEAAFGRSIYGLGVMALGTVCLAWGRFDPGQPVPLDFPGRSVLAYVAAAFLCAAGAAVLWRRTMALGAAALATYYALIVVVLMDGRAVLVHDAVFVADRNIAEQLVVMAGKLLADIASNISEQLAIAAGGLIIYASSARIDAALATRLARLGQVVFAVCALFFGAAHFIYMNLTAPLVPRWLPPTQVFWAYATGIGHIAAGVAILTGVQARLAAILLTAMYASFGLLVWAPLLLANPTSHPIWSENALNLALVGVAWVVADSLTRPRHVA